MKRSSLSYALGIPLMLGALLSFSEPAAAQYRWGGNRLDELERQEERLEDEKRALAKRQKHLPDNEWGDAIDRKIERQEAAIDRRLSLIEREQDRIRSGNRPRGGWLAGSGSPYGNHYGSHQGHGNHGNHGHHGHHGNGHGHYSNGHGNHHGHAHHDRPRPRHWWPRRR